MNIQGVLFCLSIAVAIAAAQPAASIELTSWSTGFCSGAAAVKRVPVGACVDASAYFFPGVWAIFSYPQSSSTHAVMAASYFTNADCSGIPQGLDSAVEDTCYPLTTSAPWLFGGYYDVDIANGTATGRFNCTDSLCKDCTGSVPVSGVGNGCLILGYGQDSSQNLYASFSSFTLSDTFFNAIWYNDSYCEHSISSIIQVPLNLCFGAASARY